MKKQKGYTVVEVIIGIVAVIVIGLVGFGLYVLGHFISKFW